MVRINHNHCCSGTQCLTSEEEKVKYYTNHCVGLYSTTLMVVSGGKMAKDVGMVWVLWCHSHLVWLGFHPYMRLFSFRKLFCDLLKYRAWFSVWLRKIHLWVANHSCMHNCTKQAWAPLQPTLNQSVHVYNTVKAFKGVSTWSCFHFSIVTPCMPSL